jgi:hypothetical protein
MQAKKPKHTDQLIREEIKIELCPNNMNQEDGFSISRSWKSFIHSLRNRKQKGLSTSRTLSSP